MGNSVPVSATCTAIGDVPAIRKRLQDDAQALRRLYDNLQEALAAAGGVAESEGYADVRSGRSEIRSRLGEAAGARETIRLNLLRLHAGSSLPNPSPDVIEPNPRAHDAPCADGSGVRTLQPRV